MDTPVEERSLFNHVTCNISATVDEVNIPGALALDLIEQAEVEVERLDQLKASKMKEIALKKQRELEDIYTRAHIEIDSEAAQDKIILLIDSGSVEPSELLANMDSQISKAKEEAFCRKEILDKVDKWMSACEEESWLEDYNRDENRYNSSRGAHLNLKRAEKARILVSKIPALVDMLVVKAQAWEENRGISFTYDGVPLLAMLDEYGILRQEREEDKRRMRVTPVQKLSIRSTTSVGQLSNLIKSTYRDPQQVHSCTAPQSAPVYVVPQSASVRFAQESAHARGSLERSLARSSLDRSWRGMKNAVREYLLNCAGRR
ncbi:65-kDa microtubule-associated protein 1 [Platanthera guangdongensis]|uniref:65-kDa microtubule-associated protein 1 n=1 Tax=Platanthera guangdongensis TaxID=2320717 RepID=A0ABR2MFJ7_9ASPA